jgi:hypothetical protein
MKLCALLAALLALPATATIPTATGTALDGHAITLPQDLSAPATILILGFTHASSDATAAWEKPIRASLATTPAIAFYDIAFLQDAPAFIRPLILRNIRKQVPDALKPHFLPLIAKEPAWKQAVNFSPSTPDAAYILLIDRSGNIRWQTHEPFTPALLNDLSAATRQPAAASHQ